MGPAPLQTPVRSGLPSAVRGAGAAMLGVPSGRRGVPGVGYLSHCAAAVVERSDAKSARAAALDGPIDLMGLLPGPAIISTQMSKEATRIVRQPCDWLLEKIRSAAATMSGNSRGTFAPGRCGIVSYLSVGFSECGAPG